MNRRYDSFITTFAALSAKGHALRRQTKEEEKKAREAKKGYGKRKMDEDQVRAEANKMGATVEGTAENEVNGYRENVDDDLSGPAAANAGPARAPPAKVPKPNEADGLPATTPFDWSKVAGVRISTLRNQSMIFCLSKSAAPLLSIRYVLIIN